MKGLKTDMARYWGEKAFSDWLEGGKKYKLFHHGYPRYNMDEVVKNPRSPWLVVVLLCMALPWAFNSLFGCLQFITGSFVTDSLILSLVIGAVALWLILRSRSSMKDAEEIAARYSAPEKDS